MHVQPHDSVDQLQEAARAEPRGRVRDRIRAVLGAKRGRTARAIALELGVSPRAVQDWVCWYNRAGLAGLPDDPRSGQPRKCPRDKFEAIKSRLAAGPIPADGVCTLRGRDVQRILKDEFGVVQELSTTYNLMHALGLEPLRPRPRHIKNDPAAMAAWLEDAPLLFRGSAGPIPAKRSRSGSRMRPASVSRAP